MGRKGAVALAQDTKPVADKSDLVPSPSSFIHPFHCSCFPLLVSLQETHKAFLARSESRSGDGPMNLSLSLTPSYGYQPSSSSMSTTSMSSSTTTSLPVPITPSSVTLALPLSPAAAGAATIGSSNVEDPVVVAKRLRLIAIHSPQAVSLPVLMVWIHNSLHLICYIY
jgi:hypothetical protein